VLGWAAGSMRSNTGPGLRLMSCMIGIAISVSIKTLHEGANVIVVTASETKIVD